MNPWDCHRKRAMRGGGGSEKQEKVTPCLAAGSLHPLGVVLLRGQQSRSSKQRKWECTVRSDWVTRRAKVLVTMRKRINGDSEDHGQLTEGPRWSWEASSNKDDQVNHHTKEPYWPLHGKHHPYQLSQPDSANWGEGTRLPQMNPSGTIAERVGSVRAGGCRSCGSGLTAGSPWG